MIYLRAGSSASSSHIPPDETPPTTSPPEVLKAEHLVLPMPVPPVVRASLDGDTPDIERLVRAGLPPRERGGGWGRGVTTGGGGGGGGSVSRPVRRRGVCSTSVLVVRWLQCGLRWLVGFRGNTVAHKHTRLARGGWMVFGRRKHAACVR